MSNDVDDTIARTDSAQHESSNDLLLSALLRRMLGGGLPALQVFAGVALGSCFVALVWAGVISATTEEALVVLTGLGGTWLALHQHPLNWLSSLINTAAFTVVFWKAGAPANAALQAFQCVISVYGWMRWIGLGDPLHREPQITRAPAFELVALLAVGAAVLAAILSFAPESNSKLSSLDALSSAVGVVALVLQARKRIETWFGWIVMLLLVAPIFYEQGSVVMLMFVTCAVLGCLIGYRGWARQLRQRRDQ